MKFCQSHWDMLRAEIARVGLDKFGAKSGEQAIEMLKKQLEAPSVSQREASSTFDPLMNAHWAIVNNCLPYLGLQLFAAKEDGTEHCPLCMITEDHAKRCTITNCDVDKSHWDDWIVRAVDDQLQKAKALGLVHST